MDVMLFKKCTDRSCDLTLEIVNYDERWLSVGKQMSNALHVQHDDVADVLQHGLLVRPMLGGVHG